MSAILTSSLPTNKLSSAVPGANRQPVESINTRLNRIIDDLMASLPAIEQLTSEQRRGIIARDRTSGRRAAHNFT